MAALANIVLAGISPASVTFAASHVDRNQVGHCVNRPTSSEVSATPLTFQNQIATNGQTKARNIKGRAKIAQPRVGVDPVLGEIALDVGYGESIFTFPVGWTTAQKQHLVKLQASALQDPTIINTIIGNDKPF